MEYHNCIEASNEREPLIGNSSIDVAKLQINDEGARSNFPCSSPIVPSNPSDNTTEKTDFATIPLPYRFRLLLGVSSAAMAFSSTTISLYCVNYLNFEPVQMTHYYMYLSWSALLNPIIGFVSDSVSIRGENRRPLVIYGSALCLAIFCLFSFVDYTTENYTLFVFLSVLQQWAQSCVSVPINGMMVEMVLPSEDEEVAVKYKGEGTLVIDSADGVTTTSAVGVSVLNDCDDVNEAAIQTPEGQHSLNSNDAPAPSNLSTTESNTSMNVVSVTKTIDVSNGAPAAGQQALAPSSRATSMLSDRQAKAKHQRITAMSNVQSQAMVYRSLGSLAGSIIYTVMVIWVSLSDMMWVSCIFFALIVPSVLSLSASWCQTKEYRLRKETRDNAPAVQSSSAGNEDSKSASESQQLLEKCLQCKRRFESIRDRLLLGWNWRRPSEGTIGLLFVLLFVFLYSGTLDSSGVYFTYISTEFEFAEWLNSFNMCLGMLGSVVGAYVYGWFMDRQHKNVQKELEASEAEKEAAQRAVAVGNATYSDSTVSVIGEATELKKKRRRFKGATAFQVFTFGSICGSLGYLTNMMLATDLVPGKIPIPPYLFVPLDNFLTSLFSRFAFMPILTVAAERCPEGYEAAVYELFSVASLLGGSLSAFLSAQVAQALHITSNDYSGLWILLVICAGTKFIPVLLAAVLPVHEKSATAALAKAISDSVKVVDGANKSQNEGKEAK